ATVAITAVMTADMVTAANDPEGKGILSKMTDAMGIHDKTLAAFVKLLVMVAMVAACVLTGGAAAFAVGGEEVTVFMGEAAFTTGMQAATVGLVTQAVFSSGFITQVCVDLLKACGCSDDQAQLGAMIMTIMLMIFTMAAAAYGSAASTASTAAKTTASTAADGAASDAEEA